MALGNDRPRDEPAKSKSRTLTSLGQSLRRGLTTKRSNKGPSSSQQQSADATTADGECSADRSTAPVTTTTATATEPTSATAAPPATVTTTTSSSSTLHTSSFAKTSAYTPSPLSRGAAASQTGAVGGYSSVSSSSTASLGLGGSDSLYGNAARSHRIASASGASSVVIGAATAATGAFRKTLYGSMGLTSLSKNGMNNSSPSLVPAPSKSSAHAGSISLPKVAANASVAAAAANGGSNNSGNNNPDSSLHSGRKGPPPPDHPGGHGAAAAAAPIRDYSFAIAGNPGSSSSVAASAANNAQSARSSAGASITAVKEGYLSKKTDINPSTSLASALSRGWKVYRVVLKGAKIFFYKPPSESELRAMFPEEIAAATNETAGGYFRASMSTAAHYDEGNSGNNGGGGGGVGGNGTGFPMAPGEMEAGSRAIIFEPGVHDGEITAPLCERYLFGECFTEVDLRSLKFKRYVCVLIFDDTIVVLKRRWVRQGLASSFFGAVSNKMRFGKGSSRGKSQQLTDNSSLVSAELGIQGKGYFTKWKYHSSYPLTNVEAIEAASSRFSVSHAPGVLGHLTRESQAGSGRVSLYSIGNSSVSSVMTRTSTVSKDYSGALSSGLVPGFQIFVGGKERVARMFVATTSDAKNNWLSRFAAAKASFARKLRQRPRENTTAARRYNGGNVETARRTTPLAGKDAAADVINPEDKGKPQKDARTRMFWGTQRHPELVVVPRDPKAALDTTAGDSNGGEDMVVLGGSKSALVHEMIFCTTEPATSRSSSTSVPFSRQLVGTYRTFMDTGDLLRELQRYSELVLPEIDDYARIMGNLRAIITDLATLYSTVYDAEQIDILRAVVAKTIAADPATDSTVVSALTSVIDRMVPLAPPHVATDDASARPSQHTPGTMDSAQLKSPMSTLTSYEIIGLPLTPLDAPSSMASPRPTDGIGGMPLRGRSRTHHGEAEISIPQIPTVPELIRVEITGLSPTLLLRVSPAEFAHQLYLFHKSQLAEFDPKQARLYLPMLEDDARRNGANNAAQQPVSSLLTVGMAGQGAASEADHSPMAPQATSMTLTTAIAMNASAAVSAGGSGRVVGSNSAWASAMGGGDATTAGDSNSERLLEVQRQLMVFTQSEPHFITRMVHHHLLVELPLNRPARRSALLQHWVRIGEECRIIGDAVSWAAIAMAVTMAPIARLRETWHGVALAWKDLIVTEWVPLLVKYGIYETDIDTPSDELAVDSHKPLIVRPQGRSGASTPSSALGYSYTPIPYYGTIRISVNRQGRRFKRRYEPVIAAANGGDAAGDKVLFAHYGHMYKVAQEAVNGISNIVVERARTSIMRSRASSVSLASKFRETTSILSQQSTSQQQQQAQQQQQSCSSSMRRESTQAQLAGILDPSMMGHPYLQAYLKSLALNPLKIGDEVVESDVAEYDLRYLLSISLQCEPSVADQYQQHLLQDSGEEADDEGGLSRSSMLSALRQAPGSILPLVCPETVPSTNILQWITPAARTPVPPVPAHVAGRASMASGRAGTFSHGVSSPVPASDGGGSKHISASGQRQTSQGNSGSEFLTEQAQSAVSESAGGEGRGLQHKRSQSFPTNAASSSQGLHGSGEASEDLTGADPSSLAAAAAADAGGRAEQQMSDAARSDAIYAGATVYAANGDLSLRVLRVQYVHARDSSSGSMAAAAHPLRFVVEVQGGTLGVLLDLLISGIEHHSASVTNDKGVRIQLPGGTAPALLFNRDVFQRTFMASFRHFCLGVEVVDAMRRALAALEDGGSQSASNKVSGFGTLLDVCENWLGHHFSDFHDSTALRESMAEFLAHLSSTVRQAQLGTASSELSGRAGLLLPELIAQLLAPSGFTALDKVLERRLAYAINRERRTSNASQMDVTMQSPLSLVSVADPDTMLEALNRLAQTHFARCSFNDWLVAFSLLEAQTHIPLPWYPKKRVAHVPTEDDMIVSDIYQVLEQTHRVRGGASQAHGASGVAGGGAGMGMSIGGIGGVASATAETALVRTMPHSIQAMLELHRTIRGWVIRQIVDPAISMAQRVARIQRFLAVVRLCRRDSHLSSSRVFGNLLNSYMREAGMIPDRQPSYRAGSIKAYGSGVGSRAAGETSGGRRGKRKGAQTQVKYVPAFVERAVASALVSPESRQFVRAWNDVASDNGTKLDTLEAVLRGAREWPAPDSAPTTPTLAGDSGAAPASELPAGSGRAPMQRSRSNPTIAEGLDITEDSMARADCFVPCLGWLLENMISLCYDTPDTLVGDSRLVNLAKRHRVFIMLCVCDQLATRCQEAFALPTRIRIDLTQISTWVTQTPLHIAEIRSTSIAEATAAAYADMASTASAGSSSPTEAGAAAPAASFGVDRPFSFAMPPTHSNSAAGFARAADTISPIRHHGHAGNFAKRSIANLRGANSSSATASASGGGGGAAGATSYSRKSSTAASTGGADFGVNQMAFGSPPAPVPRSLAFADGPNVMPLVPANQSPTGQGGAGAIAYMRPFSRLVTDEVEKVRQEIRERERLERELRDREQAIERQKNERTKILKRQLKEQQQRRAKNEPLLKMANLMNKVSGIGVRESSIDGSSGALLPGSKGLLSSYGGPPLAHHHAASSSSAEENRLSSASSTMRPRGPALPNAKPANVINLINSTITVEQGYTKRDFVFRIVTEEGGQYLLQAPDGDQMDDWIAAMRDAATEAAARRLTLFVEEAKKRSNGDGPQPHSMSTGADSSDASSPSQLQQLNQQRLMGGNSGSDTTRSRFTAFLGGGSSAFGGFGMGSSHHAPPVPSRGALSALQQQQQQQSRDLAASNVDPKSFGIDLARLMPDPKVVPMIVEKCLTEIELRGLEEVGIYRVSGAAADVSRLRQLFNADPDAIDLSSDEFYDINVVSGVMKQFLRELPEPLMTYNLYEGYINAASIDDYDERLWAIKDLVQALPVPNYTVLKRLVEHLERVTDYEEVNHMYGTNLALVFGPSLLRPPPGSSSFALAMSNLGHAQSVIKNLILQYHWIFNVEEEAEPIEEDSELAASASETTQEAGGDEQVDEQSDAPVVEVTLLPVSSKRDSMAQQPLSPNAQADMDQLAMAVNKLTV
ncbi:hypothetical protein H4R27_003475 [Coemansia aciculifera]|nr:hypothetical protein H4R27_003475 [Coemansia aciculifera]